MWAGVPSEPLCLHTQSLATAHSCCETWVDLSSRRESAWSRALLRLVCSLPQISHSLPSFTLNANIPPSAANSLQPLLQISLVDRVRVSQVSCCCCLNPPVIVYTGRTVDQNKLKTHKLLLVQLKNDVI
eukprot:TRINITY_DN5799_c0_g2_i4.p3 TRINITY_DN5799_c0_g2~~TRINITY_DN5799_c0_g2_i4.p3  ORF type:complete len:129 (-),score=5.37 TRINITY_DN5799_c0_g2_i4:160-546(-)